MTSAARAVVSTPGILDDVYRAVTTADPSRFYPAFGPLPAVHEVWDQSGEWDSVGRTRTLVLSDGGTVVEQITDAASPRFFAYELSRFTGPFGRLVAGARAEWEFTPLADGTRVEWRYSFRARPGWGLAVAVIRRAFWAPYMRRVLPPLAAWASSVSRAA